MYCLHTPLKVNTSPKKKPSQKEFHHQTKKIQVIFEGGVSHITQEFPRIKHHPPYQHRSIGYLPRIGQLPQTEWQGARNNWAMKEGKSSILIGFSIINHPFWGTPIFGNTHMGPAQLWCTNGAWLAWLLFCCEIWAAQARSCSHGKGKGDYNKPL